MSIYIISVTRMKTRIQSAALVMQRQRWNYNFRNLKLNKHLKFETERNVNLNKHKMKECHWILNEISSVSCKQVMFQSFLWNVLADGVQSRLIGQVAGYLNNQDSWVYLFNDEQINYLFHHRCFGCRINWSHAKWSQQIRRAKLIAWSIGRTTIDC